MEHFPEAEVMGRAREISATYTGDPLFRYLEKDEAKYLASQDGFDVLEKVLALGRPPVCLDCGSTDIEPLKVPEGVGFKTDVPVDLGIGHPGCDGRLMVEGSGGMRIALRPKTKVYDIYGQLLMTVTE
ncbi:hypothetical protein [Roseovarius sp. A46]|uniref:hypothetical protein n=1 Tax=Roseovarius sp. A46 TaxID=2109331 RepID=UPI0010131086|nr:hypothetical protein [Roseovarius sp. A46]